MRAGQHSSGTITIIQNILRTNRSGFITITRLTDDAIFTSQTSISNNVLVSANPDTFLQNFYTGNVIDHFHLPPPQRIFQDNPKSIIPLRSYLCYMSRTISVGRWGHSLRNNSDENIRLHAASTKAVSTVKRAMRCPD